MLGKNLLKNCPRSQRKCPNTRIVCTPSQRRMAFQRTTYSTYVHMYTKYARN